ncbi:MAG: Ku protein [Tepidiformaceae bacterium]
MPRPTWSGAVSFGLVNVPVKLYTAATSRDIRFNQLHEEDGGRIQQKRFCTIDGEEVATDQLVKGYEIAPDRYVTITQEELEGLDPKASRSIEIEEFVDLAQIDPVYFENSYYLVPDKNAGRAYALLLRAMEDTQKVALGRVVMRNKQYLVALRPAGDALSMATLYYADEVVSKTSLDGLPEADTEVSERELGMARQLIESLATDFEPAKYRDEHRERILSLIDQKATGEEIVAPKVEDEAPKVVDLMAALEASIAAAKSRAAAPAATAETADEEADDEDESAEKKPAPIRGRSRKQAAG